MPFPRFTVSDHERLLQKIAQVRATLAGAQARSDPTTTLELAAALGGFLTTAQDEAAARSMLRAYLPLALEHDPSAATGWLLLSLATASQSLDRRAEAGALFADALRLARSCGAQHLGHVVLQHWGRALVEQGALGKAQACFTGALQLRAALNEPLQSSTQLALDALTAQPAPDVVSHW